MASEHFRFRTEAPITIRDGYIEDMTVKNDTPSTFKYIHPNICFCRYA